MQTGGYTHETAYQVTWPEYLTFIITNLEPEPETDEVDDVKSRMRKMRAEKAGEAPR